MNEKIGDDVIDSYDGFKTNASHRTYLDIEPNISVRPEYSKRDFYAFRKGQQPSDYDKEKMRQCMDAYDHIGIISTIIDLMGDFGCQGIHLVHTNKSAENFLRSWFGRVGGAERSERFLNTLFRCGSIVLHRKYGKIEKNEKRRMSTAATIPLGYKVLNPLAVEVKDPYKALFTGDFQYVLLPPSHINNLVKNNQFSRTKFVPGRTDLQKEVIELKEEDIAVYHYKKDDWSLWGRPVIAPILVDLDMMERMKLADMSALDGAISNIRLWNLGVIDGPTNSIMPTKKSINRLRDILASNTGGGTMDLVWGPELKFTESTTQVYKWLGDQKYGPVMKSIYAGLGVPPSMTGISESSGSFSNNFVSLKVMVDRLQYGRKLLTDFWNNEIKIVCEAMGIKGKAYVKYDHMALHDEAAEKALLIQLADRDYISIETLQERFKEDPDIERARIKREMSEIEAGDRPPKSSPYHNPQTKHDLTKIALQKDLLNVEDVGLETTKTKQEIKEITMPKPTNYKPVGRPEDGRPKNSRDQGPRKQRRVLPASVQVWARRGYEQISSICTKAYLEMRDKKNLRCLNKEEVLSLERMKFSVFSNIEPFIDIDEDIVFKTLITSDGSVEASILSDYNEIIEELNKPSLEDRREAQIIAYVNKFQKFV
jgi:hypothetical protein